MSVLVWTGDHNKTSAERLRLMNSLAVDVPIDSKIYNAQPQRGLVSLRLAYDNKDKALNQSTIQHRQWEKTENGQNSHRYRVLLSSVTLSLPSVQNDIIPPIVPPWKPAVFGQGYGLLV